MLSEAFFTVHQGLPRQGPGAPEDVLWALDIAGLSGPVRVADAGCGPGADTVTLAEALPEAQIHACDMVPQFVAEARAVTAGFGDRVTVDDTDMARLQGPLDFIWCAGALYFLGVEAGLSAWAPQLSPGARIAFSHPVVAEGDPPEVAAFWAGEIEVETQARTEGAIARAGFRVLGYRRIVGAPWRAYYDPMAARIADLRGQNPGPELVQALDEAEAEITAWEAAPDHIVYGLWVVAR